MTMSHTETTLRAADGAALFAQRFAPPAAATAEVLVLHGYAEHSGRYRELAEAFCAKGIAVVAVDLRGHGTSSGRRGYVKRFEEYHLDVDAALTLVQGQKRFLLGHSAGGLVALDYVSSKKTPWAGLVITSPMLGLPASVPKAKILAGRILGALLPTMTLPSGIDPNDLTHDRSIVEAYRSDPLVFTTASAGWFKAVQTAWARLAARDRVEQPLLFAYAERDRVVSMAANAAFAERIQSPDKTVWRRDGEMHEILNETGRVKLHAEIADWILKRA
ncbi:MAG: lysophospholipase [Deltaproteobacteria bacterium]|nr:lysophospholipase [Deltaproteobacteria bacterium]